MSYDLIVVAQVPTLKVHNRKLARDRESFWVSMYYNVVDDTKRDIGYCAITVSRISPCQFMQDQTCFLEQTGWPVLYTRPLPTRCFLYIAFHASYLYYSCCVYLNIQYKICSQISVLTYENAGTVKEKCFMYPKIYSTCISINVARIWLLSTLSSLDCILPIWILSIFNGHFDFNCSCCKQSPLEINIHFCVFFSSLTDCSLFYTFSILSTSCLWIFSKNEDQTIWAEILSIL